MNSSIRNVIVPLIWGTFLLLNTNNFFFWDTIQLASKHAHWFYELNFSEFFLPEEMNSGHLPFFGMLLAGFWKVFGYNLLAGHLLMLLTILCSIYQAHKLGIQFFGKEQAFLIPLVFFLNPIFLGHSILVSPDNLLMFFFLFAINSKLESRKWNYSLAMLLLAMISMRGMMLVFCFFLVELIVGFKPKLKNFKWVLKYFPAILLSFGFFIAHYAHNQWIVFHESSPWAESFNTVGFKTFIYNLALVAWRLLDFGNLFLVLTVLFGFKHLRSIVKNDKWKFLLALLSVILIFFSLSLSGFKFLTGHRYFMPIYFLVSVFAIEVLFRKTKSLVMILILAGLFSGNFWIYPRTVSQGWDTTLASRPIYSLSSEMNIWIRANNIDSKKIGTQFPFKSKSKYIHLNNEELEFKEAEMNKDSFILYSRIMNDFKEEEYLYLQEHFKPLKELEKLNIDLILYERN